MASESTTIVPSDALTVSPRLWLTPTCSEEVTARPRLDAFPLVWLVFWVVESPSVTTSRLTSTGSHSSVVSSVFDAPGIKVVNRHLRG